MEIKLDYEQWKHLKDLVKLAEHMETKTTTGSIRLADQGSEIEIYEEIKIHLPE